MRRFFVLLLLALVAGLLVAPSASARTVETKITVRAISQGAKFIGSSVGGARITIRDAASGDTLAQGVTSGSTGNTERIMQSKFGRNGVLSTEDAAKYSTSVWLEKPRTLKITAFGPLNHKDDANTAALTQKVLPGKDLTGGDAVLLQIRGFVVDIQQPEIRQSSDYDTTAVHVKARVMMMCGCPIMPGGLWDANRYEIRMVVTRDGDTVNDVPLDYAGEPSRFKRRVVLEGPGRYRFRVSAYDPATGNTGYETVAYHVTRGEPIRPVDTEARERTRAPAP